MRMCSSETVGIYLQVHSWEGPQACPVDSPRFGPSCLEVEMDSRELRLQGLSSCPCHGVLAFHKGKDPLQLKRTLRNGAIVIRVRFGDQNLWLLIERLHMAGEGRLHSPQHDHTYTMLQGL